MKDGGKVQKVPWVYLILTGLLCLGLFFCSAQMGQSRRGISEDTFILEDDFHTPVLSFSPQSPPYQGSLVLLPAYGRSKERYSDLAETLAGDGLMVLCLDLPGTGDSLKSFSLQQIPVFLESAYSALLARNLVEPGKTAMAADGQMGGVLTGWIEEHQEIVSAAILSFSSAEPGPKKGNVSPRLVWIKEPDKGVWFPQVAGQREIRQWLGKTFSLQTGLNPATGFSFRFWWWTALLLSAAGFFVFLKSALYFLPVPEDTVLMEGLTLKKLLILWISAHFAGSIIAILVPGSALQPLGRVTVCAVCASIPLLLGMGPRWKPRITWTAFGLSTVLFLYLYLLFGSALNLYGIHLSLAYGRWSSMAMAMVFFIPYSFFMEFTLRHIQQALGFGKAAAGYLVLMALAITFWYSIGLFADPGPPASFLGFPGRASLIMVMLFMLVTLASLRYWARNAVSCALFQALWLSWLFAAGSIRFS